MPLGILAEVATHSPAVLLLPRCCSVPPLHATTHRSVAQEALELMQQCGSLDPAARPTAQQVLQRLARLAEELERPPTGATS